MNPKTSELLDRTFKFGVEMMIFLDSLPYKPVFSVAVKQLARCSTSIGANYEEAQAAESKKDFIHKIGIVSKESRETVYWLKILNRLYAEPNFSDVFNQKINEAIELSKIFTSIKLSSQQNTIKN